MIFSFLTFFVGVPSAVKVFNWTATLLQEFNHLRHAHALRLRLSSGFSPSAA